MAKVTVVDHIMYQGKKFYLKSDKKYYCHDKVINGKKKSTLLHREIWEEHHQRKIPLRHHIHHKDHDVFNNSPDNLECVSIEAHGREHAIRQWASLPFRKRKCEHCDESFRYKGIRDRRFCSKSCQDKNYVSQERHNESRNCVMCEEIFTTKRWRSTSTCSYNCAAALREKRKTR